MRIDLASDENPLASDLLRGAEEIADYIGESDPKKIYYLAEKGYLPIGRMGALLVASKRVLREHFARITAGPAEATQHPPRPLIGRSRSANMRRGRRARPEATEATA